MLSRDNNGNIMQIWSPDGAIAATAGTVDVKDFAAISPSELVNYRVRPGDPWMPLQAGNPLGVKHLHTVDLDADVTLGFMV